MTFFYPTPNPTKLKIPLFADKVPARFPSPAADYVSSRIDLNEYCISHPNATYFLYATGYSMLEAGITEGSMLVVDRSISPAHGDIDSRRVHREAPLFASSRAIGTHEPEV